MPTGANVVTFRPRGLFVAPCSRRAAAFAVKCWHYTRSMPCGRCSYWGAWFDAVFIGAVIVSRGSCANIGRPFDLRQNQIAEVTRIALRPGHVAPVSQVLTVVVRLLRKSNPGLELLVSYADSRQKHDGRGVYGGAGWVYLGPTQKEATLLVFGKEVHARTVSSKFGTRSIQWLQAHIDPNAERIINPVKHKWALALTRTMHNQLASMAQPYPVRPKEQEPANHAGLDGATPIRPLCIQDAAHV